MASLSPTGKMNSKRTGRKRTADEIHADLMCTLSCEYLDERVDGGRAAKKFRMNAWAYLKTPADRALKEPADILMRLEAGDYMSPGSYDNLLKLITTIDARMAEEIKEAEEEIRQLDQGANKDEAENSKCRNQLAQNIWEITNLEIRHHEQDESFISIPLVEEGHRILKETGVLILVGRRGSGKTKCALEILSKERKDGTSEIFKLRDVTKLNEVVNINEVCCVWFEDLFESNNSSYLESYKPYFETIKSVICLSKLKVLFTMSSTSYELYRYAIDDIIDAQHVRTFESGEYQYSHETKLQILKSHLSINRILIQSDEEVNKELYGNIHASVSKVIRESEVGRILRCDPYIGYPLCCHLFASKSEYFKKGSVFFNSPTKELVDAVERLRLSDGRSDQQQYLALSYVIFSDNQLKYDKLDFSLISELVSLLQIEKVGNVECFIHRGADILKRDLYLKTSFKSPEILELQHNCIKTATVISISKVSIDATMKVLTTMSTSMMNETIKLVYSPNCHDDIIVPNCIYENVVEHLLIRLQNGDYAVVNLPLWDDDEFIQVLWQTKKSINRMKPSGFRYSCKYGKQMLAKAVLEMIRDDTEISEEEKRKRQFQGLKEACINGFRSLVEMTVKEIKLSAENVIEISRCIRCNTALCKYLFDQLDSAALDEQIHRKFLEIFVRDESLEVMKYIMQNIFTTGEIHVRTAANIAGRVGSIPCLKWLIGIYDSLKSAIIEESIKGSSFSGCESVLKYVMEHFHPEAKGHVYECLQLACTEGLPGVVVLLLDVNLDISKFQVGELLNIASSRGFPLVVKVLIDKNGCLTRPDIYSALEIAIKFEKMNVVNVIKETYSLSHEEIKNLAETVRKKSNIGPMSAYPFTPAGYLNIPSENITTPGIYERKYRQQNAARVLKRCLNSEYVSNEMKVVKKAVRLSQLCNCSSRTDIECMNDIKQLVSEEPKLPAELIYESVLLLCRRYRVRSLSCILELYPMAWKSIFEYEFMNEKHQNEMVIQTVHYRLLNTESSRLQCYLQYLGGLNNSDSENILDFLSRNNLKFSMEEIYEAVKAYAENQNVDEAKSLNNYISCLCETYSMLQLLLTACEKDDVSIKEFLMENAIVKKEEVDSMFQQACMSENMTMLQLLTVELKYLTNEEILKACHLCCKGNYMKSVEFFTSNHISLICTDEGLLSLILNDTKNESIVLSLVEDEVLNKLSREHLSNLLVVSAQRNWTSILLNGMFLKKCKSVKVTGKTVLTALEHVVDNKNADAFRSITRVLKNMTDKQRETLIIKVGSLDIFDSCLHHLCILFYSRCFQHRKTEMIKTVLTRCPNSFADAVGFTSCDEDKYFIVDSLPPLTEEQCRNLLRETHFWVLEDKALYASRMIQKYKLSDTFTQEIFVELCSNKTDITTFITVHRDSITTECLLKVFNTACISSSIDVIPCLVDMDTSNVITCTGYSIWLLLKASMHITWGRNPGEVANKLWNHLNRNHFNTNVNEDFQQYQSDADRGWKMIQTRFKDFITHDMIMKLLHLCIENNIEDVFKIVLQDQHLSHDEADHILQSVIDNKECYNRDSFCFTILSKQPRDRHGMYDILNRLSELVVDDAVYLLQKYSAISDDDIYKSLFEEVKQTLGWWMRENFQKIISKLL